MVMDLLQVDYLSINPLIDSLSLYLLGDFHRGSKSHRTDTTNKMIKSLHGRDDIAIILMGDLINNSIKDSVARQHDDTVDAQEQIDDIVDLLMPVKNHIACYIDGNHEDRSKKKTDLSPGWSIARILNLPYFSGVAPLKFSFGKNEKGDPVQYVVCARHGSAGGGTVGNSLNNLDKMKDIMFAHLYAMGHTHKPHWHMRQYLLPDMRSNHIKPVIQHFVGTGSYEGWSDYAQKCGYPTMPSGTVVMKLDGRRQHMEPWGLTV